ncbi:MAG TPA: MauE/DoxX family redox-associated membrane protein [Candidatus Dormibacteraeota bacterium]|nr:MauE/DoxX family redox-associated membrane protein [Candidatus Dormibacteraeota bacterium]
MMQSSPLNFRRTVLWIGRLLIGGIFVYAGYSKLFLPNFMPWPPFALRFSLSTNLSNFAVQVDSYKLLSPTGVFFVAHLLPFAEIILGLLLLIGWQLRIWASLITMIMLGFLAVVSRAYLLHMDINCGCFATPEPLTGFTVLRDAALTALALTMTIFAFQEARSPHPWTATEEA